MAPRDGRIVATRHSASFELERFELSDDDALEVRGRWFGVRGRRFMRPALTSHADGRSRRSLAVLDHKPWTAEEGQSWTAAFPWSSDAAELGEVELTVAPDLTVCLPPPSPRARPGDPPRGDSPRHAPPGTTDPGSGPTPADRAEADNGALRGERDDALRSRDETLTELDAVRRDRDRLCKERDAALAARDATLAERRDAIEAEVGLRLADLGAEVERDRASASLAARAARERDAARRARDEMARERDDACVARDAARHDRDRMLAERDAARRRIEELTKRWEQAAARGTRAVQERDAAAAERDRLARLHDVTQAAQDRVIRERDRDLSVAASSAHEAEKAVAQRDAAVRDLGAALAESEVTVRELRAALSQRDAALRELERRPVGPDTVATTAGAPEARAAELNRAEMPTLVRASVVSDERPGPSVRPDPVARRRPRIPPSPRGAADRDDATRSIDVETNNRVTDGAAVVWRARILAAAALLVVLAALLVLVIVR